MDPMTELLRDAAHEIRDLRRQNAILAAKVEVMDLFACVLNTTPASRSQGVSPDVAWILDKKIAEIVASRPTGVPIKSDTE